MRPPGPPHRRSRSAVVRPGAGGWPAAGALLLALLLLLAQGLGRSHAVQHGLPAAAPAAPHGGAAGQPADLRLARSVTPAASLPGPALDAAGGADAGSGAEPPDRSAAHPAAHPADRPGAHPADHLAGSLLCQLLDDLAQLGGLPAAAPGLPAPLAHPPRVARRPAEGPGREAPGPRARDPPQPLQRA